MNAFTYNGTSSYSLGLRIESKNVFSTPQYDTTFQSIPGRDGELIIPNGRFPNVPSLKDILQRHHKIFEINHSMF